MRLSAAKCRCAGLKSLVEARSADIPLGLLDHRRRQLLQRLAGPHRVDLNLRRALQVIEPVIGIGDGLPTVETP
jgi:hypothetical protein